MKVINSDQNQAIKSLKSLALTKYRRARGEFVAEGIRTIQTLMTNCKLQALFCTQKALKLISPLAVPNDLIYLISEQLANKISFTTSGSGLIAVFQIPKPKPQLTAGLVMAQLSDPGNMGTLIRTAAAMDFKTVVVVEGCDPWSPKVVQASAGTIGKVNLLQLSWNELLQTKGTLKLCALAVRDGQPPQALNLKESLLVIGNEAHGLPNDWLEDCEQKLTIPMPGETESLNAAIAGAIALYLAKIG